MPIRRERRIAFRALAVLVLLLLAVPALAR